MSSYDVIVIGSGAGGRHAGPASGAVGQADPAARARRLAAARAGELAGARTCSCESRYVSPDTWHDADGEPFQPAGPLLRRRRDQAVRRGAVPAAQGGLRRAPPPRRHLARVADLLRRHGAVLHAGRAALPGARRARRGSDRAAGERALSVPRRLARAAHPAAVRRPRRRPACIRSTRRAASCSTRRTCRSARACGATNCDGFPCLVHAKSDAEVIARPAGAGAPERHAADQRRGGAARDQPAGTAVTEVVVEHDGDDGDVHAATSSSSPAARPTPPSCCWRRPTTSTRTGSPTAPTRSGATTCSTTARRCSRSPRKRTRPCSRRRSGVNDFYFSGRRGLRLPARQHPDGRQVAGADVPRRKAGRDACSRRRGRWRRSPSTRSISGCRPRICRGPRTGSRSTSDGNDHAQLHARRNEEPEATLYDQLKSMLGRPRHAPRTTCSRTTST